MERLGKSAPGSINPAGAASEECVGLLTNEALSSRHDQGTPWFV